MTAGFGGITPAVLEPVMPTRTLLGFKMYGRTHPVGYLICHGWREISFGALPGLDSRTQAFRFLSVPPYSGQEQEQD